MTASVAMMLVGWVGASTASAAPSNDDFGNATVITSLPFSEVVDSAGSTLEPGEPPSCGTFVLGTLWYSFTPTTTQVVEADTSGGIPGDMNVYAQTGSGFAGLSPVRCSNSFSPVVFTAQAGTTYYFQTDLPFFTSSGNLAINVTAPPPPSNDDFANAAGITLPDLSLVDTTAASTQTGEPSPACAFDPTATVWYSFTPSTSETVTMGTQSFFSSFAAIYSGSSLSNLTEVASICYGGLVSAHVDAGTTYYVQAGGISGGRGSLGLNIQPAPPPNVNFFYNPSEEPSPRDVVTFQNVSSDSTGLGFQPASWDFGDGTKVTTDSLVVTHQYAKDGDYTVTLTATTTDGGVAPRSRSSTCGPTMWRSRR
ncbi:MAG TPA: PKD domain-containing protein [Acidimicrobiales bacterium]|nr:PKD domain-containing protein [Acidimicrobiales bacterium]